jgi:hypothetical protein
MLPGMSDRPPADQPTRLADHRPHEATIAEAAAILGLTPLAVRSRLRRGTLSGRHTLDGWRVDLADNGRQRTDHAPTIGRPADKEPATSLADSRIAELERERDALATRVAWFEAEHDRLLQIVEREQIAAAELRRLLAMGLPQLPAGRAEERVTPPTTAEPVQTPIPSPRRWWQLWR